MPPSQYGARFLCTSLRTAPNDNEFRVCFCLAYKFITSMCRRASIAHITTTTKHGIVLETRSHFQAFLFKAYKMTQTQRHEEKKNEYSVLLLIAYAIVPVACFVVFFFESLFLRTPKESLAKSLPVLLQYVFIPVWADTEQMVAEQMPYSIK